MQILDLASMLGQLGSSSLELLWFPLLVWTILALGIRGILHWSRRVDILSCYHLRVALLAGLPVGLLTSVLLGFIEEGNAALPGQLSLPILYLPGPEQLNPNASASLLEQPLTWIGAVTLVIGIASGLKLFRLWQSYSKLHHFVHNTKTYFLHEITDFDFDPPPSSAELHETKVAFSALVPSPFTYGWNTPVIILPEHTRQDSEMLELMLRHEALHIQRADFLLDGLVQFVKAACWFHPLVHLLAKEAETYREVSCDATVLSNQSVSKKKYAKLLYQMSTNADLSILPTLNISSDLSLLKKRLNHISDTAAPFHCPSVRKRVKPSLLLMFLISVALGCVKLTPPTSQLYKLSPIDAGQIDINITPSAYLKLNESEVSYEEFERFLQQLSAAERDKAVFNLEIAPETPSHRLIEVEKILRKTGPMRVNYMASAPKN